MKPGSVEYKAYHREWKRHKATTDPVYREKRKAYMKRYYASTGGAKHRAYSLKRHYGITPEQVEDLKIRQGRRCAICGTDERDLTRGLHVDHNHVTGRVRGLLCQNCNAALGLFRDSPQRLESALAYLQEEDDA